MKIVWLTGLLFPEVSRHFGIKSPNSGGWILGSFNSYNSLNLGEIIICIPTKIVKSITELVLNNTKYVLLPANNPFTDPHDSLLFSSLTRFIEEYKPDLIHCYGSEFAFTNVLIKIFDISKIIVSIQGLANEIFKYYSLGLPNYLTKRKSFFDFIGKTSISDEIAKYRKRSSIEFETINSVKYVIGRSDWDKANTFFINPKIKYFHCNETLREEFFQKEWKLENCLRHSLLISQANYPIKGFHMVLKAILILRPYYNDITLNIAGESIAKLFNLVGKFKMNSYVEYLYNFILKNDLLKHLVFTGSLNESQMVNANLKAHIHISASSVENASNSVAEAMALGTPVISSFVGGVSNLFDHNSEGYFYPFHDINLLAYYIKKLFDNDDIAIKFSTNSKTRSRKTHDGFSNSIILHSIYNEVMNPDEVKK